MSYKGNSNGSKQNKPEKKYVAREREKDGKKRTCGGEYLKKRKTNRRCTYTYFFFSFKQVRRAKGERKGN
jgi:hypothetical protein